MIVAIIFFLALCDANIKKVLKIVQNMEEDLKKLGEIDSKIELVVPTIKREILNQMFCQDCDKEKGRVIFMEDHIP